MAEPRFNYPAAQRKAVMANMEAGQRQAEALERIASVLEDMFSHMYPAPAMSVEVEDMKSEEPRPEPPMENDYESGDASEV